MSKKCPPDCKCLRHSKSGMHRPRTPEEKASISSKLLGVKKNWSPDDEQKHRMGSSWRGKKLSDEHKAKMSASHTGKKMNRTEKGKEALRVSVAKAREHSKFFNTKPELAYQEILERDGILYKKQQRISTHMVDFLLPDNVVVEINGCYWHACEACGHDERIDQREKDKIKIANIEREGYEVRTIWEHELKTMRQDEFGKTR